MVTVDPSSAEPFVPFKAKLQADPSVADTSFALAAVQLVRPCLAGTLVVVREP